MSFSSLGLAPALLRAVEAEGYTQPTPIQIQAIPVALTGRDILGCAQTGTGKTAAFALPLLQRLMAKAAERAAAAPTESGHGTSSGNPPVSENPATAEDSYAASKGYPRQNQRGRFNKDNRRTQGSGRREAFRPVQLLLLAPTRELAVQIGDSFGTYGKHSGLRHTVIYGGVSYFHQIAAMRAGVDILVATPGRLIDLVNQGYIKLDTVSAFVLDEADRMLDMGFLPDLKRIIALVPQQRQTLLFSATIPPEISDLAHQLLNDPVQISITPEQPTVDRIGQSVCHVERAKKSSLLIRWIKEHGIPRAIVFTKTKHGADRVARHLSAADIRADAIHGNKSQNARQRTLDSFRGNRLDVLVATDVAARGIDIDGISHVFNYDLPREPETYVHRIGRTARAGASGMAVSFCDQDERGLLRAIERMLKRAIPKDVLYMDADYTPVDEAVYTPEGDVASRPRSNNRGGRFNRPEGDAGKRRFVRSGSRPGGKKRFSSGGPPSEQSSTGEMSSRPASSSPAPIDRPTKSRKRFSAGGEDGVQQGYVPKREYVPQQSYDAAPLGDDSQARQSRELSDVTRQIAQGDRPAGRGKSSSSAGSRPAYGGSRSSGYSAARPSKFKRPKKRPPYANGTSGDSAQGGSEGGEGQTASSASKPKFGNSGSGAAPAKDGYKPKKFGKFSAAGTKAGKPPKRRKPPRKHSSGQHFRKAATTG